MKSSSTKDNYIPQVITLGCIALFSLAVRSTTLSWGADGFTASCVFLICSVVFFLLFLAVQSLFKEFFGHILRSQERPLIEPPKTIIPSPLPSNYEQSRQEAFQVKAREEQKKMEVVTSYTQRTLAAYMSEEELTKLCEQITRYLSSGWSIESSQDIKVSPHLKSIDLMHFGWNISRPFGKKREDIAFFLKHTFAHTLRDVEVSSIQRKLTNTEGKYLIPLSKDFVIEEHSTPLESYPKVT
ncbi:mobilization protein [Porphyromonas endodontalis]|uniref:mobilization protein n=1 Tax=Porphyromonas endodontalis TaxID=28124 RepID=UPI0028E768F7|nr:mobilization protein [Porphyromonas endodontalis]